MNDTRNPQTAAAEARANYREVTARLGIGTLTEQAEEVRELSSKVTADTTEALKAHMERSAKARN